MDDVKSAAIDLVQHLPDDVTWENIAYAMSVRAKLEKGEQELKAGLGIPHEQVEREMQEWLKSSGPRQPRTISAGFTPELVGTL